MIPADRQYTKLEAVCIITADIQDGTVRSASSYAKQFGWDHKRVQRFMASADIINLASPADAPKQSSDINTLERVMPEESPEELSKVSAQQTPGGRPANALEQSNNINALKRVMPGRCPEDARKTPSVFIKEKKKENTSVLFDQFYAVYPKRKNKSAAEKAFQKLNPSAQLFAKIMDALSWQTQQPEWQKNNGQFIPFPASWLNRRRWEDERPTTVDTPATCTADTGASADYLRKAGLIA